MRISLLLIINDLSFICDNNHADTLVNVDEYQVIIDKFYQAYQPLVSRECTQTRAVKVRKRVS